MNDKPELKERMPDIPSNYGMHWLICLHDTEYNSKEHLHESVPKYIGWYHNPLDVLNAYEQLAEIRGEGALGITGVTVYESEKHFTSISVEQLRQLIPRK